VQAPTSSDHFGPSRKITDGAIQFATENTAYRMHRLQNTSTVQVRLKPNKLTESIVTLTHKSLTDILLLLLLILPILILLLPLFSIFV